MWSLAKSVCGSNLDFSAFGYFARKDFQAFFLLFWQCCQLLAFESIEEEKPCFILNKIFFSNYKMVILTIVTKENPYTVYFDQPIKKTSYIRLLSCSLYNSWNIFEKDGIIFL